MANLSPYGTCPTHTMPNTKVGGCYMCHEDARRQTEISSLRPEVSRLKATLGLPDGPTRTEVAAACIGVEPHVIEAAIELDQFNVKSAHLDVFDKAWVLQISDGHPEVGRQDHGLYWRPNAAGYTRDIGEAGIYTEEEAKRYQGPMPNPRDIARPLSEVLFKRKPGTVSELLTKMLTVEVKKKSPDSVRGMSLVRQALTERRKLYFTYRDVATDNRSERVVQPRSLVFRGDHWSLLGWCEVRDEYRSFRLDRMRDIAVMQERCPPFDAPTGKPEETDQ